MRHCSYSTREKFLSAFSTLESISLATVSAACVKLSPNVADPTSAGMEFSGQNCSHRVIIFAVVS